jgi:hypothetical protein
MGIQLHGPTRKRATRIMEFGPDPNYIEWEGGPRAESFATLCEACLEESRNTGKAAPFGRPEDYARGKANLFPDEGGGVILAVEVPEDIILLACNEFFPRAHGLIQFDLGSGLVELRTAWPNLNKTIRPID